MTKKQSGLLKRLEALGHNIFYLTLLLTGQLGAYLLLYPVIMAYVIFSRRIHKNTHHYLRRRFTDHGPLQLWWDTWRVMISFGQVLVDRGWLGMRKNASLKGELIGKGQLLDLVGKGKGLVLLTAHVGNWQTALSHISDLEVPINSLMHYEQEAVAKHYFDLRKEKVPFRIIKSDGFMGGLVESTAALQRGEVVTIMADRYAGGPHAEVDFLGSKVRLPVAAYSLAASTETPVVVLLAAKTGRKPADIKIFTTAFVVTSPEDELFVRAQIAFYASTPSYRRVMELHGWGEIAEQLSGLVRRNRWDEISMLIDQEMLSTFAVIANEEDLPGLLLDRYQDLTDRLALYLPFKPGERDDFWKMMVSKLHEGA